MSHTGDELQGMAIVALNAREERDPRYALLVTRLATRFRMSHAQVERAIEELAMGPAIAALHRTWHRVWP